MKLTALNKFYQSAIGKYARHIIGAHLRNVIGDAKCKNILGVGYANPYLRRFFSMTNTIIAITSPVIGQVRWPRLENNRCVYADEDHFPLQNNIIDIAVLVHALEFADNPWAMLVEVNRVLPMGGQVVVVVPNRAGLWASKSSQPFGYGRAYTKGQLQGLMHSAGFELVDYQYKLFFPPFKIFAHSSVSVFFERWAGWLVRENSGVIIAHYEKKALEPVKNKTKQIFKRQQGFQGSVTSSNSQVD